MVLGVISPNIKTNRVVARVARITAWLGSEDSRTRMEVAIEAAATLTSVFPMRMVDSSSLSLASILRISLARVEPLLSRYSRV